MNHCANMFGEIVICKFPFTSGAVSKIRPALELFDLQQDVVICRVTSAHHGGPLDADALSAFADADRKLLARFPSDRPWALPVVVIGEYRFGLQGSREAEDREQWFRPNVPQN